MNVSRCAADDYVAVCRDSAFVGVALCVRVTRTDSDSLHSACSLLSSFALANAWLAPCFALSSCARREEWRVQFMMQSHNTGAVLKPPPKTILSPPSRSGVLSVYATKLVALAFVWLCSIVVWGHQSNVAAVIDKCNARCIIHIIFAFISWLFTSMLLIANYRAESDRTEGYTSSYEPQATALLIFFSVIVVISASTHNGADFIIKWFAWLGFFGSIYATFKSYHSFKEGDLPTVLPENFDEEIYVYG
ncbi:unnamed protein product [Agarophyton chilense]